MSVIVDEDAGCDGIAPVDQCEVKRVVIDTCPSHAGGEEHRRSHHAGVVDVGNQLANVVLGS